ncbi:MAG: hypothetical protein GX774_06930 [Armatimonadetes bacterium]|jgi:hypothetical protein|nr:hypothetical protein [Armatimonadota bacterium]
MESSAEQEREAGPERIERLPGEMESAMYSGTDDEPPLFPEEVGPPADRQEAIEAFERADEVIAQLQEAQEPEQAG